MDRFTLGGRVARPVLVDECDDLVGRVGEDSPFDFVEQLAGPPRDFGVAVLEGIA
jgi:hypothetical protein